MSKTVCIKTGIIAEINDSLDMTYTINHPLSSYKVVAQQWEHKKHVGVGHLPLLAGSLITILAHHKLSALPHSEDEALQANYAICSSTQATSLLHVVQRLLNNTDRIKELGNDCPKFTLATASLQGTEQDGMEQKFFPCLVSWLDSLVPVSAIEVQTRLDANMLPEAENVVLAVEATDSLADTPLDAAYRLIEDNVAKSLRRQSVDSLAAKRRYILNALHKQGLVSDNDLAQAKLQIKGGGVSPTLSSKINKAAKAKAFTYSNRVATLGARNKLFEQAALIMLLDAEIVKQEGIGFDALEACLPTTKATQTTDKPKLSLKERLAARKASKGA